jgi:hypothetical protein
MAGSHGYLPVQVPRDLNQVCVSLSGHIRTTSADRFSNFLAPDLRLTPLPSRQAALQATNERSGITKGNHPDHVETEPDRTEHARNP